MIRKLQGNEYQTIFSLKWFCLSKALISSLEQLLINRFNLPYLILRERRELFVPFPLGQQATILLEKAEYKSTVDAGISILASSRHLNRS